MVVIQLPSQRGERPARRDWRTSAACRTADPELFFPVSEIGPAREDIARAKEVCYSCRVRRQCLQFALATHQIYGVWGGTTEEERRLRVREQRERQRERERIGSLRVPRRRRGGRGRRGARAGWVEPDGRTAGGVRGAAAGAVR